MPEQRTIVIAGTDTDVGKTVFSAALASALDADYWKPVQAGLQSPTDSEAVAKLGGLAPERIHREIYRLNTPASPHRSAEIDGLEIEGCSLRLPRVAGVLIVELAGGLLVPLTRNRLQIDLVQEWGAPVVLVARTTLGTINHTLLSLEALRSRNIDVLGVAFSGDANDDSERTIAEMGNVKGLGRLPQVSPLTADCLAAAFSQSFDVEDFK